jgi:hypothetical protein
MGGLMAQWTQRSSELAACAVALALTGCGGGDKHAGSATTPVRGPHPTESLQQAIDRIGTVASAGDCGSFEEIYHPDSDARPALCRRMLPDLVPGTRAPLRFSKAAGLMYGSTGGQTILALDRDGHYKVAVTLRARDSDSRSVADRSMLETIDALRRNDCEKLLMLSFQYAASGRAYCESEAVQVLHRGLARDPHASPVRLGGTGFWAVYGLALKAGGYYTLIFAATPAGFFQFMDSYAAA